MKTQAQVGPRELHMFIYIYMYMGYIPFRFVASLHRVVEITLYEKIKNYSKHGRLGGLAALER